MRRTTVYFSTKDEADKHYKYCNPPGGRPDITSGHPYSVRLVDPNSGEEFDGWAIDVKLWSLD